MTERRALEAGLELDETCVVDVLADIDSFATCGRPPVGPLCPVYTAHAEVGERCEIYDFLPWMTECRAGLRCIQGTCRDLANPHLLYEGEICSTTQADYQTGNLGECVEGLVCDSDETRTCVPSTQSPRDAGPFSHRQPRRVRGGLRLRQQRDAKVHPVALLATRGHRRCVHLPGLLRRRELLPLRRPRRPE